MNQFHGNIHYQRQVVRDRHDQLRRELGAARPFHDGRIRRRGRARPGPIR